MTSRILILLALCSVALFGCAGSSSRDSRAGGERPAKATTLVLASPQRGATGTPLQTYANEVARRSNGTLRIRVQDGAYHGDPDAERRLIEDVRTGKLAFASVGARALDLVGIKSFQALVAPMLITSQRLQDEVVGGAIGKQMLASLKASGLTGVAIFSGPMRRMLGVTRTYRTVDDLRGARIGFQRSHVADATLRALGARPVPEPSEASLDGIDGYEQQFQSVYGNSYYRSLRSITTNLALWPRPLVIIANPAALAKLTQRERYALTDATAATRTAFAKYTADGEHSGITSSCGAGVRLVSISTEQLEAKLRGVYDEIERDAATKHYVEQITALRESTPADSAPKCSGAAGRTSAKEAGPYDGVYRSHVSAKQQADLDGVPVDQAVPENYGDFVLMIDRGRFVWSQQNSKACTWAYGTESSSGSKMIWDFEDGGGIAPTQAYNRPGEHFVWGARLYHGTLSIRGVEPTVEISGGETWHWRRVADKPSERFLFRKCLPPAKALTG